ncbi:hypothetical protein ACIBF6_45055 [Streptosporangium amethystogenes]|uniref:hypothetical protein n=1 Tax=Streptosporangium amethystogenes TaxID=2002 RepID=UPI0037A771E4
MDKVSEGTAVDIECSHSLLNGSIKVATSGVDNTEIYVGVSDAHRSIGGAVGAGVHLDCFKSVFFGAVVVFEPGVGGGGVEDPLGVVEHEVVIRIPGKWKLRQGIGSASESLVGFATVADSG